MSSFRLKPSRLLEEEVANILLVPHLALFCVLLISQELDGMAKPKESEDSSNDTAFAEGEAPASSHLPRSVFFSSASPPPAASTASAISDPPIGGMKNPARFKPSAVALQEIRRHQASPENLIRKLPFQRMLRHVVKDFNQSIKFQSAAIAALQGALEVFMNYRCRYFMDIDVYDWFV